ncbi:AIPR family protein [Sandarakinorhabdus oryzae]|uniref:AIPR family protein n=1 Tax=Sandarakinorhabdus oryzae TaxID=2675220 RepID=UPI0012E0D4CB|nr:AIPR family protein [Sandarakinorhabdus oryzae]
MSQTIEEFQRELARDVVLTADATGDFKEEAFFEIVASHLVDAGELETHERTHFADRGLRIDGHGGHPRDADGILSLIVQDFSQSDAMETLTNTDMQAVFNRATQFMKKARDPSFRRDFEESSPAFEAALHIDGCWAQARRVKLILLTNKVLSTRVDGRESAEIDGKEVVYSVWDLGRLFRYISSGREREEMELDLVADYGGAIPALPAHLKTGDYQAFLAVVPGAQVALIYDRWGSRLLEQNVRSFLQLKGGVNKGMAKTIIETPEMFFAYNNGITATAEAVELDGDGSAICKIRNLQIVNGGQTTASLHLQRTRGTDLSKVFVQMKLSIVQPEFVEEIVPKISEYANTQNKVNAADFFANHPFHIELQKSSRQVLAPAKKGTFVETRWFYERSRGQFVSERSRISGSALKKFDADFPSAQLITKTDLAKALNLWPGFVGIAPESVSRGAQKTFSDFAKAVSGSWTEKRRDEINDAYFKECVSKIIIYKESISIFNKKYPGAGYPAQTVAYAIAKLASDLDERGECLSFMNVWLAQSLTPGVRRALEISMEAVRDVLTNPPIAGQNISEWAKVQLCWMRVKALRVDWPSELEDDLLSTALARQGKKEAKKDKQEDSGIAAQAAVLQAGSHHWEKLLDFAKSKKLLSPNERQILALAARPGALPNDKQCLVLMRIERTLKDAAI